MRTGTRNAARGEATGTIRLAAFRSAAFGLLPRVLVRFGRRHPRVSVDVRIVPDLGRDLAGEVADGRADVGSVHVEGLLGRELDAEPYVPAHPDPRAVDDRLARELLGRHPAPAGRARVDPARRHHGRGRRGGHAHGRSRARRGDRAEAVGRGGAAQGGHGQARRRRAAASCGLRDHP
ncbi:LysR substrate-binding domain-containing protein [Nonomuraea terrae]|uniref:LysR substrate-binding domain-containing protein n=1 Tax=Nonomuraea terrae TaxID=2530383 RepID=UPI0037AA8211